MIMTIPDQIEYLSKYLTLNEGDMILSGTPNTPDFIAPGDTLETSLSYNGLQLVSMVTPVVSDNELLYAKRSINQRTKHGCIADQSAGKSVLGSEPCIANRENESTNTYGGKELPGTLWIADASDEAAN